MQDLQKAENMSREILAYGEIHFSGLSNKEVILFK